MKLLKNLVLVVAAGLMMTACGGGGATPSEVAKKAMEATFNFDSNALKDLVAKDLIPAVEEAIAQQESEEGKAQIEMAKGFLKEAKFEVVGEEIAEDGNTATVTVKVSAMGQEDEQTLNLVKEEGKWKLSALPGAGK
jgi:ABC-type glycerol-3-phosphate transport system substrate-binding protein